MLIKLSKVFEFFKASKKRKKIFHPLQLNKKSFFETCVIKKNPSKL